MDLDKELKSIFFEEGREHIASLEEDLIQLETDSGDGAELDHDLVNRIFRSAHTIKGGAGSVGFTDLAGFTHTVENVLDRVRENQLAVSRELISVLLSSVDCMARQLDAAMGEGDPPGEGELSTLVDELNSYLGDTVAMATQVADEAVRRSARQRSTNDGRERTWAISLKFSPEVMETGTDPAMLLTELSDHGTVRLKAAHLDDCPPLEALDPYKLYLSWDIELTGRATEADLDGVFIFIADDNPIQYRDVTPEPAPEAPGKAPAAAPKAKAAKPTPRSISETNTDKRKGMTSVRVDTDRLDRLVNLVGELVIGQARVSQVTRTADATPETAAAVEALERITRDLQDEAMGMRMLPIGPTFVQFQRVVRDLAMNQGKEVSLQISGQETELDKSIIEKIGDPLKHMVRNAVDHGLETPSERQAVGKPFTGTVNLRAFHAEGNIVIEIEDDGKGLDAAAIAAKAIKEGLIPADHQMTDTEIYQLVFHPGLSTAKKVTDVSGRGVGMDVVKRNIEELRGRVQIDSRKGEGTIFRITLPLTLAIIEGMGLSVGDEVFLIPLLSIVESIRPNEGAVQTVAERGEVVSVRGDVLPVLRLHEELNVFSEYKMPHEALLIVVEVAGKRFCLLVDDIIGQQQVVIKSVEQNYRKVEGVSGATILGDGRVAMILDVPALVRRAFKDV
ncbi:MAG: chemotaxis protein CheA [Nitrospirota bacterium]|nr:chemotaxis protein CheA [Nitrospirota bacterium]